MPYPPKNFRDFSALVQIVRDLRGPEGCPWDKEQDHHTLTQYAIEEAFELAEAIESGKKELVIEELGDLLLQVVLHAEIARQNAEFDLADIIETIGQKMVRRHPHVFADLKVKDSQHVLKNWAQQKESEKKPLLDRFDIPVALPALLRSQKIGAKTKKHNFDWTEPSEVLKKVEEEVQELKEAMTQKSADEQQKELGDLLFSVVQLARHLGFDAEQTLRQANQRFEGRFFKVKKRAESKGRKMEDHSSAELEAFWSQVKRGE